MFEILSGGLLGSIFGGLFRLAPEVLKFLDKGNERKHELSMFTLQTDLEKMRGQFKMEERYVDYSVNQLDAIKEAFKEQASILRQGLVGGVRPIPVEIPESGKLLLVAGALPPERVAVELEVK